MQKKIRKNQLWDDGRKKVKFFLKKRYFKIPADVIS